MDLSKSQCHRLIGAYKEQNCLWDRNDNKYVNKDARKDAWRHISREMNIPVGDLKKKMTSLLGSYRREKSRENKSRIAGSAAAIYKSKWFAYKDFAYMTAKKTPATASLHAEEQICLQPSESADNGDGDVDPRIGLATARFKQSTRTITSPKQSTLRSVNKRSTRPQDKRIATTETSNSTLCDSQINFSNKTDITKGERVLENEFDIYGLYVASQLKLLSEEQSVIARGKIQSVLTECRLTDLRKEREKFDVVICREENDEGKSKRFTINQFNANDSDSDTDQLVEYLEVKSEVNDSDGSDAFMEDTNSN